MDETSRSVLYETLRSKESLRRTTSSPKKLFLAHVALQKQCNRLLKYQEQQRFIESSGFRCKIQQMERIRDKYAMEKQRIEEQRERIAKMLSELDSRRAIFKRIREKTMHEIKWLESRKPSSDLRTVYDLRSDSLGLQTLERWKRANRTTATIVREETAMDGQPSVRRR